MPFELLARPLSRTEFAPFGDVIETHGRHHHSINDGSTERYHDLALLDLTENGGRPLLNLFRGQPFRPPLRLSVMERHPLSSQAFMPLQHTRFAVVVATPGRPPQAADLKAFLSDGSQGVNYHRGVWHHPLLALDRISDFMVIDRGADDSNCDIHPLPESDPVILVLPRESPE